VPQDDLVALVERAIVDERDGHQGRRRHRQGYHAELDELRAAAHAGKQWIAEFQAPKSSAPAQVPQDPLQQRLRYFIEITKANLAQVPPTCRKQTVVNGERSSRPAEEYENKSSAPKTIRRLE
jgi:DNA mismatch repair protein MutS